MAKYVLGLVGESNINRTKPETAFAKVQSHLSKSNFLFGHMETSLAANTQINERTPDLVPDLIFKQGWKHSSADCANGWKAAGFDALGCASNASGDPEAVVFQIKTLDEIGLPHAGIGANIDDAHKPAIVEKDGVKFGLLSYTSVYYPQFIQAYPWKPGAATAKAHTAIIPSPRMVEMPGAPPTVKTWMDAEAKAKILDDIAKLKPQVDHVVLSIHWGASSSEEIQEYRIELAHDVIDAGVDVIVGHHPHMPNGIEIYKGKPIFYSTGNICFDWWFCRGILLDGVLGFATFEDGKVAKTSFVPVRRDEANDIAAPAPGSDAFNEIVEKMVKLSKPFGTKLEIAGDEVIVTA